MREDTAIEDFRCDVCGNCLARLHKSVTGIDSRRYDLVGCTDCSMIVTWPLPGAEQLESYYASYGSGCTDGIVEWDPINTNRSVIEDCRIKLENIEKYAGIDRRGGLLDIGCGHGFFVHLAKTFGYEASGVDIDGDAVAFGRSEMGLNLEEMPINNLVFSRKFEVVTAWEVLEHLRTPGSTLKQISDLLAPGGVFAGSVPNMANTFAILQKNLIVPPEHLQYFNTVSMRRFLEKAGFEPLFIGTIPIFAAPNFTFLLRAGISRHTKGTFLETPGRYLYRFLTLVKRHVCYSLLNKLIIRFNLEGDNLLFVARKQ